jgi:phage major head subunit gpT-like protein
MFVLTFQDIRNDDADVLATLSRRIGRGGMLKLNDLVWRLFLNNGSFFTAGRNNVVTGAGSALSLDGLAAAEKVFINQTDPNGNPLGLMPSILLVPPTLKATALSLMNSQLTITGGNSTMPNANVWQGRFSVESSPYMENSSYTGYSAAAWYLLASPAQLPVIEIAALDGNVQPTVETADAAFNVLGVEMRGHSHVGVALQEYRGGVRAAGS